MASPGLDTSTNSNVESSSSSSYDYSYGEKILENGEPIYLKCASKDLRSFIEDLGFQFEPGRKYGVEAVPTIDRYTMLDREEYVQAAKTMGDTTEAIRELKVDPQAATVDPSLGTVYVIRMPLSTADPAKRAINGKAHELAYQKLAQLVENEGVSIVYSDVPSISTEDGIEHFEQDQPFPELLNYDQRIALQDFGVGTVFAHLNPEKVEVEPAGSAETREVWLEQLGKVQEQKKAAYEGSAVDSDYDEALYSAKLNDLVWNDVRRFMVMKEVATYLKENPGSKVVLLTDHRLKWTAQDFPKQDGAARQIPEVQEINWPGLTYDNPDAASFLISHVSESWLKWYGSQISVRERVLKGLEAKLRMPSSLEERKELTEQQNVCAEQLTKFRAERDELIESQTKIAQNATALRPAAPLYCVTEEGQKAGVDKIVYSVERKADESEAAYEQRWLAYYDRKSPARLMRGTKYASVKDKLEERAAPPSLAAFTSRFKSANDGTQLAAVYQEVYENQQYPNSRGEHMRMQTLVYPAKSQSQGGWFAQGWNNFTTNLATMTGQD